MFIKINTGTVEIPGQDFRPIEPVLSVERFKEELEVLDSASQGKLGSFRPDREWLKDFGQRLFQAVFETNLSPDGPLVLAIAPELRELPWELLHNGEQFLAFNPGILRCFSEDADKSRDNSPITRSKARVTVLLASPLLNEDPDLVLPIDSKTGLYDPFLNQPGVLDFRKEVQGFTDLEGKPYPVFFDLYRRTKKETFREQLLEGPDILHFSGHGNRGCLFLETDIATSTLFNSQDIMDTGIHPDIRLVVLNGCLTAAAPRKTDLDGISMAEAFGRLGVHYVIAMQYSVSTASGTLLSEHLYRHIAKGRTIAEAVRLSRFILHEQGPHPWEFAVPILFTAHPGKEEWALVIQAEEKEQVEVRLRGGRLTEQQEERFAGRRRELVKIAKVLDRHNADRGVLLHGAGGMGKTATALEAAHRFGEDFDEVVFAAARRELPSPELSAELKGAGMGRQAADVSALFQQVIREFRELGRPVSIPEGADSEQIRQAILNRLCEPGRRLLILDNLEDLFLDPDKGDTLDRRLVEFLDRLPTERCRVILTSRTDFVNLPREYRRVGLNPLEGREIGEFFRELLRDHEETVDVEDMGAVLSKTGAHPITLRLALALLEEGVSLKDVLDRLTDPLEEPWRYLVEKALERMGEEESEIYQALSLFQREGTAARLSEVVGIDGSKVHQALRRLLRFSLVTRETHRILDEDYYGLLPLLREDAERKRMTEPERESKMKQRFSQWVLREIDEYVSQLEGLGNRELNQLDQEKGNILEGGWYLFNLSQWDEALKVYDFCIRIGRLFGHIQMESAVMNNMGSIYLEKGEWAQALEIYRKALKIKEQLGDLPGTASTLGNMGIVYHQRGEWSQAIEMHRRALETFKRLGNLRGMARTYNNMGLVLTDKRDGNRALDMFGKSLEIDKEVGDLQGIASTFNNMGVVLADKGDLDRALAMHEKALKTFEQLGDHHGMADTFNNIGVVLADKGELDRAKEIYGKALEIEERIGDLQGMAKIFGNIGLLLADKREWNLALEMYEKALKTFKQLGDLHGMAQTFNNMGIVYRDKGIWDRTLEMYGKAMEIEERLGDQLGAAETRFNMAILSAQKGDFKNAVTLASQALEIFKRYNSPHIQNAEGAIKSWLRKR